MNIIDFERARGLTKDELALLERLKPAPKCMHDGYIESRENHWQCHKCGMIAKKTIK